MDGPTCLHVLLVEDNPGDARLVTEALTEDGTGEFRVRHVNCLGLAVECLSQSEFDAIVVDLSLPDAHGLEAVERLVGLSPDAPLLVLSGDENEELAVSAVQCGAQDFLVKGRATREILTRSIRYARERKRQQDELAHLARIDPLTALPNRMHFDESLPKVLNRMQRSGGTCALLYLDLDNFKPINDTLGHQAGDQLLRDVAQRLSACLRRGDTVCRLGGDEFALILEGVGGAPGAAAAACKVGEALSEDFQIGDTSISVSASVGIALYPFDATDAETLVLKADDAMYTAKREGWRFALSTASSRDSKSDTPPKRAQGGFGA